eukprot:Protomagalhaensia_sp_Gyna_25__4731@NODE_463_length_3372_cov_36_305731_g358_i0_p3_GENE_NODE_463_length_3372_cov_36_305731_g358_i0NODE_463_length_3372_cov_36_305731_g358_i0_p3_ORF_typecomplete_len158_score32_96Tho1_MOS11_C/PF18592_1/0_0023Tho1_MOS11_C/PF18592_1/4_4e05Tho1_MOS11_C/PF18592_1/0_00025DUF3106/PF11304_8/0_029DUF3106/PF11304_8/3_2NUMOD3/PF07460_11/0_067OCC1/PF15506_6/8e03OCC1/PF15506_6/0_82_NODE_463_length_3372_cov_36_305731_g358_i024372910
MARNRKSEVPVAPQDKAKIVARSARFGTFSEEQKAKMRAARFGTFNPELEKEKVNKRMQRFAAKKGGIGTLETTPEEQQRRIERAKRFGVACPALDEEKRKERAQRFGIGAEIDAMNKHLAGNSKDEDADEPAATAAGASNEKEEGSIEEDDKRDSQ